MNLTGIISISGKPGLYKVIAQSKNSIIVESLDTNKRVPAYATDRISAIEDISIYTYEEEVPLKEIFASIYKKENGKNTLSHKEDIKKLETYFSEILPSYDKERVYPSDVRKVFQWYNKLNDNGFISLEEEVVEAEVAAEEKPKKETKAKEEKPKEEKAPAKKETKAKEEKTPAKKTTKVAEAKEEKTPAKKVAVAKKKKED